MASWAEELKDFPINPALTGGNGQGAADPAGNSAAESGAGDPPEGGNVPPEGTNAPPTEGSAAESGTEPEGDGGEEKPEGAQGEEKPGNQTPEERHRNAEARKSREREQLRGELRQEMQSFLTEQKAAMQDEVIRGLHLNDPYTGKPITKQSEYDAFIAARDREAADQALEGAGIDRGVIDSLIEQHPAVLEAKKLAAEAAQEKTRVLDEAAQKRFDDQLREIQAIAPEIKTAEDLMAGESYDRVRALVRGGASIADAWKAVNLERVAKHEREAAAQAVRNGITGKDHMQETPAGRGEGAMQMSAAVTRKYRETYPGLSDEELRKKFVSIVQMQKKRG